MSTETLEQQAGAPARVARRGSALGLCPISHRSLRYRVELHPKLFRVVDTQSGTARAPVRSRKQRGTVRGLSSKSRSRFLRLLARINRPDRALFVTLSYQTWVEDWKAWKRDLDTWFKAVKRTYPALAGAWRMEFQERGAPHWHALLWLGEEDHLEAVRARCSSAWLAAIGQDNEATRRHAVTVDLVNDIDRCGFYIALYQAKDKNDRKDIDTGRLWGVVNKKALGLDPEGYEYLTETQFLLLRRLQRGLYKSFKKGAARLSFFHRGLKRQQPFTAFQPVHVTARALRWCIVEGYERDQDFRESGLTGPVIRATRRGVSRA